MSDFEKYLDWLSENWDLFEHQEVQIIVVGSDSIKL